MQNVKFRNHCYLGRLQKLSATQSWRSEWSLYFVRNIVSVTLCNCWLIYSLNILQDLDRLFIIISDAKWCLLVDTDPPNYKQQWSLCIFWQLEKYSRIGKLNMPIKFFLFQIEMLCSLHRQINMKIKMYFSFGWKNQTANFQL